MSVGTMSKVFEYDMPELKTDDGRVVPDSTAKFVLLALADHCNDEGEGAYPGVKRICKKTSMSSQTVCNALNALRNNGYTTLQEKPSRAGTNNYTINLEKLSQPLGFQPLESQDSSHQNRSVPAARVKPSINHQINRESIDLDFRNMSIPEARKVPTLKLYADATEYFPGSVLWETVHKTIAESGVTFDKLHAAAVEWEMRGYKKENVKGILEWAINGIPGGTKQAAEVKPAINETAIEKTKELVDRKTSGSFVPRPETIGPPVLAVRDLAQRKGIRR